MDVACPCTRLEPHAGSQAELGKSRVPANRGTAAGSRPAHWLRLRGTRSRGYLGRSLVTRSPAAALQRPPACSEAALLHPRPEFLCALLPFHWVGDRFPQPLSRFSSPLWGTLSVPECSDAGIWGATLTPALAPGPFGSIRCGGSPRTPLPLRPGRSL